MKFINLIFSGVSSISTLSLAALAIYGAFFTNLPEVLIRQLRVEVSEVKEQVIDLTNVRRELTSEIKQTHEKLIQINQDFQNKEEEFILASEKLKKYREELSNKKNELSDLEEEIERISAARKVYFQNSVRLVSRDLINRFRNSLLEALRDAERARDLGIIVDWVERQPDLDAKIDIARGNRDFAEISRIISKNLDDLPDSWKFTVLLRWNRDATPAERDMDAQDHINKFIMDIAEESGKPPVTFEFLFREAINGTDMSVLLSEDKSDFLLRCEKFIAENKMFLNKPSKVRLFGEWNNVDSHREASFLIKDIDILLHNIEDIEKKLSL